MTVPKFRAWTEEGQVMYYNVYPFHDESLLLSYDEIAFDEVPAIEFILMQSTGLVDINGVEIWEGDVVKTTWFKDYDDCDGYRKTGRVVYADGYFGIKYPEDREDYPPQSLSFALDVETIGNIYENPELVED